MWSKDDTILVSAGQDGMVFAWKIDQDFPVARLIDFHQKAVVFHSIAISADNSVAYASCSDLSLHLISLVEQGVEEALAFDVQLSQVLFPSSNKLLFGGVSDE